MAKTKFIALGVVLDKLRDSGKFLKALSKI